MALTEKIKSSGIWQTIEVIVVVIAQFLYMAIMARLLTKPDFGLMAIANGLLGFGNIFAEAGMGAALIQRKNLTNKHINAAFHSGIILGLLLFAIFFLNAPLISKFYENPKLADLIRVIAVNFLIFSVSAVSLGILQKEFKFKEKSFVTILAIVISYSIGIICGIKGYGVWSLVIASLTLSILQTIGYFYFTGIKLIKGIFITEWKELFYFSFGVILSKICNYLGLNGINLAIGKIFSPGLVGVFERTFRIKTLPSQYIGDILDKIMFPAMSEIQDEKEKLFQIYQVSLGIVNTILMPLSLYLIFFSKEIVLILLGKDWSEAVIPLQIMFVVLAISSSSRMADTVIRAKGLIYKNVVRKFLYVVFLLICTIYGGSRYGLIGAAVGVTVSYLFNYLIMLVLVKKIFKKGIFEIFLAPVLSGLKLTGILLIILIIATTVFNSWKTPNIPYFLILSFILGTIVMIILWKNPSLFGEYSKIIFSKLRKK